MGSCLWPAAPSFNHRRKLLERRSVVQVAAGKRSSVAVSEYTLEILALISRVCLCRLPPPRNVFEGWGSGRGRGYSLECAAAGVWRRAPEFQRMFLGDLALDTVQAGGEMLEVVADGLPLFRGAQIATNTTGVTKEKRRATAQEMRRKARTYPKLCRRHSRVRLVVYAAEVGGKWSHEAADFLEHLAKAKAGCEPRFLQVKTRQAWKMRWNSLLACSGECFRAVAPRQAPNSWRRWKHAFVF